MRLYVVNLIIYTYIFTVVVTVGSPHRNTRVLCPFDCSTIDKINIIMIRYFILISDSEEEIFKRIAFSLSTKL